MPVHSLKKAKKILFGWSIRNGVNNEGLEQTKTEMDAPLDLRPLRRSDDGMLTEPHPGSSFVGCKDLAAK